MSDSTAGSFPLQNPIVPPVASPSHPKAASSHSVLNALKSIPTEIWQTAIGDPHVWAPHGGNHPHAVALGAMHQRASTAKTPQEVAGILTPAMTAIRAYVRAKSGDGKHIGDPKTVNFFNRVLDAYGSALTQGE